MSTLAAFWADLVAYNAARWLFFVKWWPVSVAAFVIATAVILIDQRRSNRRR